MIKAAGILFVVGDTALFLRRGNGSSMPNLWCTPGGKQEDGEDLLDCAIRETLEECGYHVRPDLAQLWTRTLSMASEGIGEASGATEGSHPAVPGDPQAYPEDVDFSTYIVKLGAQFTPKLDLEEHDGYAWAPINSPPEPLHPGVRIALERFQMDELDVAEAMAAGRLTSPQKYENVWLFAMRITGTGVSYRSGRKEFVHRDSSIYCNERFLRRCNGLQVIWEHPDDGSLLNDDQFKERTIGAVFLPYIRPDKSDEVWGITKVYDDEAAIAMCKDQLSTSPAVNFKDPSVNYRIKVDGGDVMLIEGDPSLLDHLAVCAKGVWDKGGAPTGIDTMADSEEFNEADHPRGEDGKFGSGGGSGKSNKRDFSSYKKLTIGQKEAIEEYQFGYDSNVNEDARKGEKPTRIMKSLDRALSSATVNKTTLYRGLNLSESPNWEVGSIITDKGYVSTTEDRGYSKTFATGENGAQIRNEDEFGDLPPRTPKEHKALLEISTKDGERALRLPDHEFLGQESEVLLPRNTKFKVIGVTEEDGIKVFKVETVDDGVIADAQKIEERPSSASLAYGVNILYAQAATLDLKSRLACK